MEGIAIDITERKQAEEALRLAEENYRSIFENALEGIFQSLPEGRFIKVNPAFARMLGYESPQELIETVTDIASQTYFDSPRRAEFLRIMEEQGSVTGFEFQMKRKDGQVIWINESARAVCDEAGNLLYYEGAAEDITERKRMEQVLRESEENTRLAYDAAQLGTWKQDVADQTFHFDKRARQHFDLDEAQPPQEILASRIHPEDVPLFREQMAKNHTPSSDNRIFLEYRVIHRDGSTHWLAVHALIHFEKDGETQKAVFLTGTSQDITEHKQAEETLRLSEEKYRLLAENMSDTIWLMDMNLKTVYISPSVVRTRGFTLEELNSLPLEQQMTPESLQRAILLMAGALSPENLNQSHPRLTYSIDLEFYRKDGIKLWSENTFTIILGADGQPVNILGSGRDITERRQAEDALRESEARYRTLLESTSDSVYVLDREWRHVVVNEAATRFVRMPKERLLGNKLTDLFPSIEETVFFKTFQRVMETRIPDSTIGEYTYPDGQKGWYEVHVDPTPEGILCISRDITERRQAEDALRESLHKLEEAERISHVGHYEIDAQTGKATWSREVFRIFGRDLALGEPTVEEYGRFTHPEDGAAVSEMYARSINEGIPFDLVYRILKSDGQIRYVHSRAETARNEQGQVEKLFGTFQDITEGKLVDEKLQSARKFLQGVQDSLSAHIAILDSEGNVVQVNEAWQEFGRQNGLRHPNHCIGANYLDVCDAAKGSGAEEAALAAEAIRKVLGGTEKNAWFEYSCHETEREHGKRRWFIARITSFENDGRKWVAVSHENITARRQIEERQKQQIAELEVLYENSLAFTRSLNPREIAQKMIELLGEKLDWHHTAIRLLNEKSNTLELAAFDLHDADDSGQSDSSERLQKTVTHIGEGLSGWAIQQGKTLRIDNVAGNAHYAASYPGIHSGMYAPLKAGDRVLGVISIESEKPNAFSESDEQLINTLTNQVAIALENARLYREIRRYADELEERVRERTAEIDSTRQRLELAVKTAGLGIWELDLQSGEELWDDRTYALRGFSREENHPSEETWRKTIHPQDLPQVVKRMEQTLRDNEPYDPEYRVVLPGDKLRHIKTTAVVIHDELGKPSRMLGADQDITLHKQAEETLLQANAEMERSLRMKTEFLATMSHELRTPLNSILGISESLEEQIAGSLNEKQLKYIRIINESGHHLLELINDILDLSKIEAGKLELTIETISVEKLCNASLRMIKELAQKKALSVSFKMDPRAKYMSGDERRMKQILVNLLSNAVKFTPSGREIGLEVRPSEETHELRFTVWDQGIGIAEEDMKHLFQPFVQLQSGLAREYGGSGLGLALVAQMARLHGGNVTLKSKLDFGSRFTVALPWSQSETSRELKMTALLESKAGQRVSGNAKVLIVDDTEVVAHLVSEYLQHKGYQTRTAGDGLEGILKAKQEHPQIILMDVMMPEMNGLDATRKLRADPDMKDVIIIGLTALAMPADREQCLAAGMNDHISKPIQMQELAKIIEHHLRQNG
jgi:PAS domain S-box-containing protein